MRVEEGCGEGSPNSPKEEMAPGEGRKERRKDDPGVESLHRRPRIQGVGFFLHHAVGHIFVEGDPLLASV